MYYTIGMKRNKLILETLNYSFMYFFIKSTIAFKNTISYGLVEINIVQSATFTLEHPI